MEPEGSVPYSQEPVIGPSSEPDESNPQSHTLRSILTLSSLLRPGITSNLFPSSFKTKTLCHFPSLPTMLHDPTSSFFFIWTQYMLKSTNHYAFFFPDTCYFFSRRPKYFPLRTVAQTP
jgi:hypothetical protein